MRFITLIFLIFSRFVIAQNNAPKDYDLVAKNLKPIKDRSLVYFLNSDVEGKPIIYHDTTLFGQVRLGQFAYKVLDPGHYVFNSEIRKKQLKIQYNATLESDKIYYLEIVRNGLIKPMFLLKFDEPQNVKTRLNRYRLSTRSSNHYSFTSNAINFYVLGRRDGELYYETRGKGLSTINGLILPLGLILEPILIFTPPKINTLDNRFNPNNNLLYSNKEYYEGFRHGAKRKKKKELLKPFIPAAFGGLVLIGGSVFFIKCILLSSFGGCGF